MNELFQEALHRRMNKLERKLAKYASIFFGKDIKIIYVPAENLKNAKVKGQ